MLFCEFNNATSLSGEWVEEGGREGEMAEYIWAYLNSTSAILGKEPLIGGSALRISSPPKAFLQLHVVLASQLLVYAI